MGHLRGPTIRQRLTSCRDDYKELLIVFHQADTDTAQPSILILVFVTVYDHHHYQLSGIFTYIVIYLVAVSVMKDNHK